MQGKVYTNRSQCRFLYESSRAVTWPPLKWALTTDEVVTEFNLSQELQQSLLQTRLLFAAEL